MPAPLRLAADPAGADRVDVEIGMTEAGRRLGVSVTEIRRMLRRGDLRGTKIGRSKRGLRVSAASVAEYKISNRVVPDTEIAAPRPKPRTLTAQYREAVADLADDGLL